MVSREIKVIIVSPSDTHKERRLLLDKLSTYFTRYKYEDLCKARIIVDGWETLASQTGYPQDTIKLKRIKQADIILALFRHKLGSPTYNTKTGDVRAVSGTVEELGYAITQNKKNKKPLAMVYYYKNPPRKMLFSCRRNREWKRLEEFKRKMSREIKHTFYIDDDEALLRSVCDAISDNIREHRLLVI